MQRRMKKRLKERHWNHFRSGSLSRLKISIQFL
ncbi:hypothetical protein F383_02868 [Gossypium arboreum]|uniref:Uncharacterized protein n=1 Tax=Gossypium arboreum TaxID=29729 RepID=A0A0B0P2T7_GOSAR|nr:hypothetical protein F383_02868 [Gossypium arboreum]